mmetsp:Transcript_40907/g.65865  ORF Transcript_40907/g.65865 Transcript_40907/m.65865 type:complete len:121 (-) Transcript_40907:214-576(-)
MLCERESAQTRECNIENWTRFVPAASVWPRAVPTVEAKGTCDCARETTKDCQDYASFVAGTILSNCEYQNFQNAKACVWRSRVLNVGARNGHHKKLALVLAAKYTQQRTSGCVNLKWHHR